VLNYARNNHHLSSPNFFILAGIQNYRRTPVCGDMALSKTPGGHIPFLLRDSLLRHPYSYSLGNNVLSPFLQSFILTKYSSLRLGANALQAFFYFL